MVTSVFYVATDRMKITNISHNFRGAKIQCLRCSILLLGESREIATLKQAITDVEGSIGAIRCHEFRYLSIKCN